MQNFLNSNLAKLSFIKIIQICPICCIYIFYMHRLYMIQIRLGNKLLLFNMSYKQMINNNSFRCQLPNPILSHTMYKHQHRETLICLLYSSVEYNYPLFTASLIFLWMAETIKGLVYWGAEQERLCLLQVHTYIQYAWTH